MTKYVEAFSDWLWLRSVEAWRYSKEHLQLGCTHGDCGDAWGVHTETGVVYHSDTRTYTKDGEPYDPGLFVSAFGEVIEKEFTTVFDVDVHRLYTNETPTVVKL